MPGAAAVGLPHSRAQPLFLFQVFSPAGRRLGGHVRSRQRDECRHSQLLPEGVLVQAGLLSALFLLLSLQVGLKHPCDRTQWGQHI